MFFLFLVASLAGIAQKYGVIQLNYKSVAELNLSETRFYQNDKYLGNASKTGEFLPKKKLKGKLRIENNMCLPQTVDPGSLGEYQCFTVELKVREVYEKIAVSKATKAMLRQCEDTSGIVIEPDEIPTFPGGYNEFKKFIGENVHYPKTQLELGIEGTVYVCFILTETGSPSCFYPAKTVINAPDFTEEALRVLALMPAFNPAKEDGEAVKSIVMLPITFKLQ